MATSGRGDYHAAILAWRWNPKSLAARAVLERLPADFAPRWIATVPPIEPRPDWIPPDALALPLPDDDTAYVW